MVGSARTGRRRTLRGGVALLALSALSASCTGHSRPASLPASPTSTPGVAPAPSASATQVAGKVRPFPMVLSFSDTRHGLLIGLGCPRSKCPEAAWLTADGGHTWTRGGDLPRGSRFTYAVNFFAADAQNLFLSQSDADYASHDGGLHWSRLPAPRFTHLVGVAGSVWLSKAVACRRAPNPACTVSLSSMIAVGGPISSRPAPPTQGEPIASIQRVGHTLVLEAGQADGGRTVLLSSTDAGYHWITRSNPCGRLAMGLSASADGALWALCAEGLGAGQEPKKLFVSADAAQHWAARPDPQAGGYSRDVHAISATVAWRTGYAGSGRSDLFRTQDAGRTWTDPLAGRVGESGGGSPYLFAGPTGQDAWVAAYDVFDPKTNTFAGPALLVTHDGGHTWHELPLPIAR